MYGWTIWMGMVLLAPAGPATAPATASAPAGAPADGHPGYTRRDRHDPNGIGKFYLGREIAQVMGHTGIGWLERPEREEEEHSREMLELLAVRPGDVVADIGAGSGYHTLPLARMVGPKGRIKAVDIQPEMLAAIRKKARETGLDNIDLVLGAEDDPRLEPESVDLILLVDVYHEFEWPFEMTRHMVRALKPGGRIVFVEFRAEDPKVPIKAVHKMTQAQVIREMKPHPLRYKETIDKLPWQHMIVFEKTPLATRPVRKP
ncbi:MAG: class I SAM-dependent methyltransferase [Phycisphaerae bacterium]